MRVYRESSIHPALRHIVRSFRNLTYFIRIQRFKLQCSLMRAFRPPVFVPPTPVCRGGVRSTNAFDTDDHRELSIEQCLRPTPCFWSTYSSRQMVIESVQSAQRIPFSLICLIQSVLRPMAIDSFRSNNASDQPRAFGPPFETDGYRELSIYQCFRLFLNFDPTRLE